MEPILAQRPNGAAPRMVPDASMPVTAAATLKEIPYDYVARFQLEGRRGNRVQDVINISVDGAFVAVAIGYSFIPARLPEFTPVPGTLAGFLGTATVANTAATMFSAAPAAPIPTLEFLLNLAAGLAEDPRELAQCLLVRWCGIDFKYSIIDSGTGRELQNLPIHNIAGLGEPTGDRPFRPLAKPMLFMPRSSIRIEIEEISTGQIYGYTDDQSRRRIGAELFIVLHGYKILGYGTGLP